MFRFLRNDKIMCNDECFYMLNPQPDLNGNPFLSVFTFYLN